MAKRIAGKLFQTPEEAGVPPLTEEQIAEYMARANAHRAKMAAVPEEDRVELSERFHDDLSGTEYEGWTPEDDKK
ncbi:hypothetical protein ACQP0C_40950 [Nocardia sp. CA-129566]|uniref:hypothetical protein n=1 Tax=Nocardia sp. CA-129566 TaxID=3239976 RepID=UPI003D9728E2